MSTTTTPTSVAAWRVHKSGPPPNTLQKDEIPTPKPAPGQILVQVHAAALNPIDWKVAALAPAFIQKWPHTLASDFSGVVAAHGPGLTPEQAARLPVGTRIAGINNAADVPRGKLPGALATFITTSAATVTPIPDRFSWAQGAAIPLTSLTARSLAKYARAGDRVLVLGGSTSVGLSLIQQLKIKGAKSVTATASGDKIKAVKELGADEVVDYRSTNVVAELARLHPATQAAADAFDVILDTVGDLSVYYASAKFLKPDGVYANVGASELSPTQNWTSLLAFLWTRVKLLLLPSFVSGAPRTYKEETLTVTDLPSLGDTLLNVDEAKALKPLIDSEFSFDQAKDAYARIMTGRALGKVVVHVQ